jgi:3-carboxy-cis,cis-muconate cycloisomerase
MTSLIRDLAACPGEMLAVFGDESLVSAALAFEAKLALAEAAEGLISERDAALISAACASLPIDIAALAEQAAHAGTLAIPLVRSLRDEVARTDADAATKVHLGGTSQDLADTALILQVKAGAVLIEDELDRLASALAVLVKRHAATPMLGRTLLQAALPITFGLKAANWLLSIDAAAARFRGERDRALMLQFGGASGSLAGLGGKGLAVAERLAGELGLRCPPLHWQSRRGDLAGLAASLAIIGGAVGKIARDIALLAQGEVAEAFEPRVAGRGGSSAMAHKRNPTGCQIALSAAIRMPHLAAAILSALPQEHERGLGGWQAEAPMVAELFELAYGALKAMRSVIEGLEVDVTRMRVNLDAACVGFDTGESEALAVRALDHHAGNRA